MTQETLTHPIRYSPRPIEAYTVRARGPAYSIILAGNPLAWNLAWLSHDYALEPESSHPDFNLLISRTLRARLKDGTPMKYLLSQPAPYCVARIKLEAVGSIPMDELPGWRETIAIRDRECEAGEESYSKEKPFGISADTRRLLSQF